MATEAGDDMDNIDWDINYYDFTVSKWSINLLTFIVVRYQLIRMSFV